MTALEGRALARLLGNEGGAVMNEINALIKGIPEISLTLVLPCEDTTGSKQSATQKWAPIRTPYAGTLISSLPNSRIPEFQPPELCEINFCCLKTT